MDTYKYKALSRDGEIIRGIVEACSEFDAVDAIRQKSDILLKIEKTAGRSQKESPDLTRISDKVLSMTASQLAVLLRSGLPMAGSIELLARQTKSRALKKILQNAAEDVDAGYSLYRSLEKQGKSIPITFLEMIKAGEESGTLEESCERLGIYYGKVHKVRTKVRSAMSYPTFLLVVSIIVIAVVMKIAVPVIGKLIQDGGGELPAPTRLLMSIYGFFGSWWWLCLALAVVLAAGLLMYGKTEQGRVFLGRLTAGVPIMGEISRMKAASQLAETLSTMLAAGMPMNQAVELTGMVMDNHAIGSTVQACTAGVEEGRFLSEVLRDNPYLPQLLTEMLAVGEESGSVEEMLASAGDYFEAETDRLSTKALSMMEPILTLVLGLVIGFIVIALYLPMFTMYSEI